ncbi:MAG: hypothetical protein J6C59_09490 [Muribaculaceae bacterium]|nr:hypothetical protein [Muribaculaceae bacterium]
MENKDYVSYELALALKKCGFDEPCDHYYCAFDNETDVRFWGIHPAQSQNGFTDPDGKVIADAPLLSHVQKWLREKKEIFVEVTSEALHDWDFFVMELDEDANIGVVRGSEIYPTYEQALSAGIAAALELIKK